MADAGTTVTAAPPEPLITRRLRIFTSPVREPRFRRATDVVLLISSLLALAILVAIYPPGRFERSLAPPKG